MKYEIKNEKAVLEIIENPECYTNPLTFLDNIIKIDVKEVVLDLGYEEETNLAIVSFIKFTEKVFKAKDKKLKIINIPEHIQKRI